MRVPEKIGKYYGLEVAGRGNMAVVYRGYDPFSDREVAIKLCKRQLDAGEASGHLLRKLFFNEAQAAGSLIHPHIVRVTDAGEHEGSPYLIMEYVAGKQTLRSHCGPRNRLKPRESGQIIYDCARALDYSHRHGVIHRDVKPTNILLARDRGAKLTDFGIAQRDSGDTTQIMGLMGSPMYMSPEQITQDKITPRTDIYALGVVMYELLVGAPPFSCANLATVMYRVVHDEAPPLPDTGADTPQGVARIVHRCLQKNPRRRFSSAGELADALADAYALPRASHATVSERQKSDCLAQLEFFSAFTPAQIREVLDVARWQCHAPGETIVLEGTLDLAFHVIAAGTVTVRKGTATLCRLDAGACFGEMGYLARAPRTATIVAEGPVMALMMSSAMMKRTSQSCQLAFNEAFIRTLIERLAHTSDALVQRPGAPL